MPDALDNLRVHAARSLLPALLAAILFVVLAPAASAQSAPGPLLWTAPAGIDSAPIDSVDCLPSLLCVGVDRSGHVLWSTNPAGGGRAWRSADVDNGNELTGVSCPAVTLCVAVDGPGNVITSANPTGGATAWTGNRVDTSKTQNNTDNAGSVLVRGVSCPATTLCVAVDAAGNSLFSANPAGGAGAWTVAYADANTSFGCAGTGLTCQPPITGVSCPSAALCAAVDFSGNILTTGAPGAGTPWPSTSSTGGGLGSLYGISCPTVTFCATVDGQGGHAITFNPAAPAALTARTLPYSLYGIWCQSASLCLASVETPGGISALLGSFDPAAPRSSWSPSSLGGVNAVSCPSASLCLAADDEGNVAAGATVPSIEAALRRELLPARRLPTIAQLDRRPYQALVFTSPIAAQVAVTWSLKTAAGVPPLVLATAAHRFTRAGAAKLVVRLTDAGRAVFRAATHRFTLTAAASFTASTGSVTQARQLTFAHPPKPKPKRKHRRSRAHR